MDGWGGFILALGVFYAVHALPVRPGVRAAGQARLGRRGYAAVTGLLQLATLAWVIVAAGQAPWIGLWDQMPWMRWTVNLAMPVAVALVVLAIGTPNPLSFGGPAAGFDPARPGLAGLVRHPVLWALLLWSSAHMLVNGDLAHVLLFGGFALFSALGMVLLDRRRQRDLGADWARLAAHTSNLPFAGRLAGWRPSPARLAVAAAVWLALLWLHPEVIGVSPLP